MILQHHRQEWQESCINDRLTDLNLRSLGEQGCFNALAYSPEIKRLNTGVLPSWILNTAVLD